MRPSFSLAELLPHRPPMVLIDEVVDVDVERKSLIAAFVAKDEWSGNWVAIEYMAQTAAALAGYFDRLERADRPARPGFLLGTRKLELKLEKFSVGGRYRVRATNEFSDGEAASFACEIEDERGEVVATAMLNAYRPENVADFLKSNMV